MSESVSEFFDAQEVLLSASSSENEVRAENRAEASGFGKGREGGLQAGNESMRVAGVARKSDKQLRRWHELVSSH